MVAENRDLPPHSPDTGGEQEGMEAAERKLVVVAEQLEAVERQPEEVAGREEADERQPL